MHNYSHDEDYEPQGYLKKEIYNSDTTNQIANEYSKIITLLGEDGQREGLEKTPIRVAKAMQFLTHGYNLDPEEIIRSAMFQEDYQQMVVVKQIEIFSMC